VTKLPQEGLRARLLNLPPDEHDAVAQWLLAELSVERAWDEKFSSSQAELERLAKEPWMTIASGRTTKVDPDSLLTSRALILVFGELSPLSRRV
jgi:hypothetical protein